MIEAKKTELANALKEVKRLALLLGAKRGAS